eukprot:3667929-Rhodomonas_salina.1
MNLRTPPKLLRARKHGLLRYSSGARAATTPCQPMPVRGMPGPASIPPVRSASMRDRAVLFNACHATTQARTLAI